MTILDARALPRTVFGSATAARGELAAHDAALRAALSTTRRIGIVSLVPAPTAGVAAAVVRAVAARRSEPVLAVDLAADAALARALGVAPTAPNETRAAARTTAEALTGLRVSGGVVGLAPATDDGAIGAWLAEAAPIARFFEVAVTHFGAHHPLVDLGSCAALCDVVCVVADAGRSDAEHARSALPAIAALPEHPAPVLALVDASGDGAAIARAVAATTPHPVIPIPADAGLRAGGAPRTADARRTLLRLAATLVSRGETPA